MSGPPIQSISIPRSEQRTTPSPPHRVYAILINLPVRSWTVYRRYSEFLALHTALTQADPTHPTPAPFPPKHAAKHAFRQITSLGGWLGSSGGGGGESSSVAGGAGVESMEQRERRAALETYLRAIIASTDPRWRLRDEFLDFLELPKSPASGSGGARANLPNRTTTTAARLSASGSGTAASLASARTEPLSSPTALFPSVSMPGAAPSPQHSISSTTQITRQLGAAPPAPAPSAQPSEHLAHQQALLTAQDASLSDLSAIIRRQRELGLAIHQELAEQSELLGVLDEELGGTEGKMRGAEKKMERLEGKR